MFGVVGIGRALFGAVLPVLGVHHHPAVGLGESIDQRTFGLQRVFIDAANLHLHDEVALGAERILPFVTAVAAQTARTDDARRHIEPHLGALAQQEFRFEVESILLLFEFDVLLAEMQRIAHGQVSAFDQSGVRGAAVAVIRHVMGVFGEGPELIGFRSAAREGDVAAQVAAREIELHPADRIVHRFGIGIASLKHIDVIAALGLVIFQQFGMLLRHIRFEGLILELVVRLGLIFGTGGQQRDAGCREVQKTGDQFHISLNGSFFGFVHSTDSTVKYHATGLSRGIVVKYLSPKASL